MFQFHVSNVTRSPLDYKRFNLRIFVEKKERNFVLAAFVVEKKMCCVFRYFVT